MTRAGPPPTAHQPAARQKYDRQLRIWGEHGQEALKTAQVCLLNCGPTGSEALKNLVLGGIGSFTIVDEARVKPADLGNNFLVDHESLGQLRAKCVSGLLQELNEGVAARFVEESPETLIEHDANFFSAFTLIVATQMTESSLVKLDTICRQRGIMLITARAYGLVGSVRISLQEHRVIESKPDNPLDDLRIHRPWEELREFANSCDIDTEDLLVHQHIPFAVLLVRIADEWRAAHGGRLPKTAAEKAELKSWITARKREPDEENYKEALASAFKVWSPPSIGPSLQAILNDGASHVNSASPDFWVMVAALKEFMRNEGDGELPLDGAIPDMHSFTDFYIALQQLYQKKAAADVAAVAVHVQRILKEAGQVPESIPCPTIKLFCKNARNLQVIRYRPLAEEQCAALGQGSELHRMLAAEESSNAVIYVLLRAVDVFAATFNRYPGVYDSDVEEDIARLKAVAVALVSECGLTGAAIPDDLISEICRFGPSELHATAAVIGGIVAQEAIKLLTKQFVPLAGTLIYNGMSSTTSTLPFS
ncbi:hypothetical protein CBR_g55862 [Chara braunii]|uniref:NEDD8-activating enzyme E1 regulatory subunit n=1 Tax=Chara braunii TaxID=69332 RepID=A0A388MD89_CHABU|nr:hypothetical protein CBR_g55862 [Chara braunii]|eukprot:GBG92527.1 hypothetical protein CBR_g55862 [Chara braunii]